MVITFIYYALFIFKNSYRLPRILQGRSILDYTTLYYYYSEEDHCSCISYITVYALFDVSFLSITMLQTVQVIGVFIFK